MIGSRLAQAYTTRFSASADPADLERALELTRLLVDTWPDKSELRTRLAALHITEHRFTEAFEIAGETVRADSADQGALGVLFDAAMAVGEYETAASALDRLEDDSFGRRIREARWLDGHGETPEARRLMRGACERVEDSATSRLVVAWCFTRLADMESGPAADAWHDRALTAWPDYRGVREARADEAYATERWTDARELYMSLRSDAHPDIYQRLAEVARARGRTAEADRWTAEFERVATPSGVEPMFAQPLAIHLARNAATRQEAVAVMRRDVARRPSAENHAVLAWTLLRNGEPDAALVAVEAADTWGETSAEVHYLAARALEALDRTDEAAPHRAAAEASRADLPHHLQLELLAGR